MSEAVILLKDEPLFDVVCQWLGWIIVMIIFIMAIIYATNYFATPFKTKRCKKNIPKYELELDQPFEQEPESDNNQIVHTEMVFTPIKTETINSDMRDIEIKESAIQRSVKYTFNKPSEPAQESFVVHNPYSSTLQVIGGTLDPE